MKKLLIASSAIVGVSMLATTASAAGVTGGGSYTFTVNMGGADKASDAMTFGAGNYSFFVSAEKTTDTGLTLTGASHIDGKDSGQAAVWDEATAAIAGGFGTVSFSNEGGSATGMASGASGLSVSWNDINDIIKTNENGIGGAGVGPSDGGNTVTYTSPNISGFKAGITLGRNGGNSEFDASKEYGAYDEVTVDGTATVEATDGNNVNVITDESSQSLVPVKSFENMNREYTGYAFSYNVAGATIAYASGTETASIDVKGYEGDDADYNGKHEETWSGTKLSVRYATGPLTVGYSVTTKGEKEVSTPGKDGAFKATEDKGDLANLETNETEIGVSYNYGAGTVSYVMATEDVGVDTNSSNDVVGSAENVTTSIIAVSHSVGDGVKVFFEQHSGSVDIEYSPTETKDSRESVSEIVLGLGLTF
ncbi:MAG: porin [Alphaproteobacteria bacterium]|nr:porin [Alphaproteobacteria bacterium]